MEKSEKHKSSKSGLSLLLFLYEKEDTSSKKSKVCIKFERATRQPPFSEYSEGDTVTSEEEKNPGLNQIINTMVMIQYLREQDEKRRKQEETQRVEEQERRKQEQEQQEERWTKLFELSKHGAGSIVDYRSYDIKIIN